MFSAVGQGDFALFRRTHHAVAQTLTPHFIEQGDLFAVPASRTRSLRKRPLAVL